MFKQIVDAARVPGQASNIYCLGPFARRVSFIAQQYRALNLVWALKKHGAFSEGDSVAIVGAGVAGITAATAFIAHGCQVDVFESANQSMARQRNTEHRMVHPSINMWPHCPLSITTELPFLEWHADVCDHIVKNLSDQFEKIRGENRLLTGTTVTAVVPMATDLVRLVVRPPLKPEAPYRLVLIAIGFGNEVGTKDFASTDYWSPDGLEGVRSSAADTDVIVSGCGDGGLIDALRVLHQNFGKGRLAFLTAALLSNTDLAAMIGKGEVSAREHGNPNELAAVYNEAAKLMATDPQYADAQTLLDDSLRPEVVYLVDKELDEPYSLWAAPIHKLMIAHAKRMGRLVFFKGEIRKKGKQAEVGGRKFAIPPDSRVIIRHGAKADFGHLIGDVEVAGLRSKLEVLTDYHTEPAWEGEYPLPKTFPKIVEGTKEFATSRWKLARRAIQAVSQDADIEHTEEGFTVYWDGEIPPDAPATLFRVPVTNELLPQIVGL